MFRHPWTSHSTPGCARALTFVRSCCHSGIAKVVTCCALSIAWFLAGGKHNRNAKLTGVGIDTGAKLFEACTEGYFTQKPKPMWVSIDRQSSLTAGEFAPLCKYVAMGITSRPGQAHWMHGTVERNIQFIKQIISKLKVAFPLPVRLSCLG